MDCGVPVPNVAVNGEAKPLQCEGHNEAGEGNYDSIDNIDSAGIKNDSSSSAGKLFVGGISWDTSEDSFSRYFRKYGETIQSVIMLDKDSGRSRGFGFVTFADPEVADKVLQEDHVIDGKTVAVKRHVAKEDVHGSRGGGLLSKRKIFVGGLPSSLSEDDLRNYFSPYGKIVNHQIKLDHESGQSRGFGFVTFENEDAVEKLLSDGRMHKLGGKQVEIKKAEPKRYGIYPSSDVHIRHGVSSSRSSSNFIGGQEGFGGGYGGQMNIVYDGGYGSYGGPVGYGTFPAGIAAGFYAGYGWYGYGGPMYGGGGFGVPVSYGGGVGGYDVGKGYGAGPSGGYNGGGSGGHATGKGFGNGNGNGARYHPYRR